MSFYAKAGLGAGNADFSATAKDSSDARSSVWEELVNERDQSDGAYCHNSRHGHAFDAGGMAGAIADGIVMGAVVDTVLNVPSGLNFRDTLGLGDAVDAADGAKAAAGIGTGFLGTLLGG